MTTEIINAIQELPNSLIATALRYAIEDGASLESIREMVSDMKEDNPVMVEQAIGSELLNQLT